MWIGLSLLIRIGQRLALRLRRLFRLLSDGRAAEQQGQQDGAGDDRTMHDT